MLLININTSQTLLRCLMSKYFTRVSFKLCSCFSQHGTCLKWYSLKINKTWDGRYQGGLRVFKRTTLLRAKQSTQYWEWKYVNLNFLNSLMKQGSVLFTKPSTGLFRVSKQTFPFLLFLPSGLINYKINENDQFNESIWEESEGGGEYFITFPPTPIPRILCVTIFWV